MKILFLILTVLSFQAFAQDPATYLTNFDNKVYSLKTKGVKDFVVDIVSPKLTKQLNDQMIFGQVKDVYFRAYWTANPERLDLEIIGLPDGFREIKEELKLATLSSIDNLLPMTTAQRFNGYKFHSGATPKEIVAQDSTGIASVPSFILRFDNQDKLIEIVGRKPIGSLDIKPVYEKDSFADGKWVLKSLTNTTSENGQTAIVKKVLSYGTSQGMGVLTGVSIRTEQKSEAEGAKPLISEDSLSFKNYKINTGEGMKHFLSEPAKKTP